CSKYGVVSATRSDTWRFDYW
nr:immunoglobulin heavy chain junction region [Macaca mulatta]